MLYHKNFSLKNYNSFKLDSIAKEIWFPQSIEDLKNLLIELKDKQFFVLGGGTNVLLKPEIDRIICLKSMPKTMKFLDLNKTIVSSNYSTALFINTLTEYNIAGFEGLYGIIGELGGAIVMNSGSGIYTISDQILTITSIDLEGNLHTYSKNDLKFDRRYSVFQDNNEIVLNALFDISVLGVNNIELEKAIKHRKTLPKYPSAGGIFVNWHNLKPYSDKLIGLRIGDAEVSDKINIIVNKGNATFDNIIELIKKIENVVETTLKLEVKIF